MSNAMYFGLLVLIYVGYLLCGAHFKFPVAFMDWEAPYFHYSLLAGSAAWNAYVLPGVLLLWAAFLWYRKSMTHEA